ncbi:hypothetical protein, partial [Actinomyces sp. Z5]|uniref:hypothetical protein n=1 Tax=Actinomyces sp. Z5 TaxID=2250216 RepID=UPI001C65BB57
LPMAAGRVGVVCADPGHFVPPRAGTSADGGSWADRLPACLTPPNPRLHTRKPEELLSGPTAERDAFVLAGRPGGKRIGKGAVASTLPVDNFLCTPRGWMIMNVRAGCSWCSRGGLASSGESGALARIGVDRFSEAAS